MKEKIVFIGGGGHCHSVIDVIEQTNKYEIIGIVDTKENIGKKVLDYEIIACDDDLETIFKTCKKAVITIGHIKTNELRKKLFEKAKNIGFDFPTIISPLAYVSKHSFIEEGTVVMHHALVNANAKIGKNCIINTKALIEHDCIVEDNCHISTASIINGGVVVKENTFFGSNAMSKEYIEIGKNCLIGGYESTFKSDEQFNIKNNFLKSKYFTENDLKDYGFKFIGKNVRISSDVRIYGQENISIGNNVRIDDFTILSAVNGYINIGNYVFIARGSHLSGFLGIDMQDFSSMAANTVIYSASDDYSGEYLTAQAIPQKYTAHIGGPVNIGKHVIIGANSTIVGPCNIGEGCSIGTMTFVQNELLPWGIYVGIPCKRIKERKKELLKLEKQFLSEVNL